MKMFGFFGLKCDEIKEVKVGDLVVFVGMEDIFVGEIVIFFDY